MKQISGPTFGMDDVAESLTYSPHVRINYSPHVRINYSPHVRINYSPHVRINSNTAIMAGKQNSIFLDIRKLSKSEDT